MTDTGKRYLAEVGGCYVYALCLTVSGRSLELLALCVTVCIVYVPKLYREARNG